MKPIRLEVKGFTAFREPAVVDFEGRRLFAITGPTGAGKSSLLDAMTWALYGQVPRVGRSTGQLLAHGEHAMTVLFEFSVRGKRYRVARRSPGTTSTRLEEATGTEEWRGLADHANEVTREVTRILGLDYPTFTRTVLLPQGAFDSFLKGDQSARREIMTRLLGLGVYTEARRLASGRATRAKDRAEVIRNQLEQLHLAAPEQIDALQTEHAALAAEVERLTARREQLATLGDLARAHRDAANRAAECVRSAEAAKRALCDAEAAHEQATKALEAAQAQHAARTEERAALGYDLEAHRELERRVALIVRREEAEAAVARARQAAEQTATAVQTAEGEESAARKALDAATKALDRATSALEAAGGKAGTAAGRAQRALDELVTAAESHEAEAAATEAEAQQHEERVRRLVALREQLDALDIEQKRATAALEVAAGESASARKAAEAAQEQRRDAEQAVEGRRADLDRARVEQAAATIQRSLKPGDPCPVCGEPVGNITHHDAPDLDAAEAALAEAERVLADASRDAEARAAEAAACAAREQACRTAVDDAEAKRAALASTLSEHEVTERGLQKAIATAEAEVAKHRERASNARAAARREQTSAQELRLALAKLPEGIEVDPTAGKPEPSPAPLAAAIEAHREAAVGAQTAEQTRRDADANVVLASKSVQQARERCSEAEAAVAQAEALLAERYAEEDGDAAEVRAAHAEAERHAKRAGELDAAVAAASSGIARAESRGEAAQAQVIRARSEATAGAEAAEAAEQAAAEAHEAFERGWRETVADGQGASFDGLRAIMSAHTAEQDAATQQLGVIGERLEQARAQAADAKRMRDEATEHERAGALADTLAKELVGNRFVAYVQHEAMSLLANDASSRLAEFTSGRYELTAEDDEFEVIDRLNGDERRSVKTLSGGETFLASLALALSLSEHLPQLSGTGGSVSLESLFLDEGFGSLDAESLDLAVQGLETLAGGHRMIGVISHVAELAERLPDRIEVVKGTASSTVRA